MDRWTNPLCLWIPEIRPQRVHRSTPSCPQLIPRIEVGCPQALRAPSRPGFTVRGDSPPAVDRPVDNLGIKPSVRWTTGGQPGGQPHAALGTKSYPQIVDDVIAQRHSNLTRRFAGFVPRIQGVPVGKFAPTASSPRCGRRRGNRTVDNSPARGCVRRRSHRTRRRRDSRQISPDPDKRDSRLRFGGVVASSCRPLQLLMRFVNSVTWL